MQVNYKLNTNELNGNFLEAIKLLFKDKEITISITDADDEETFGKAIEAGLLTESVSRAELNSALYAD